MEDTQKEQFEKYIKGMIPEDIEIFYKDMLKIITLHFLELGIPPSEIHQKIGKRASNTSYETVKKYLKDNEIKLVSFEEVEK